MQLRSILIIEPDVAQVAGLERSIQRRVDCNQRLKWGRLYGFEYKRGVVTEAKGSPEYIILEDGTHTRLKRAGMKRTGTEKN